MGQIKATVDTAGKSGFFAKYITIYTNDRMNPATSLTMTLEIVQK